MNWQNRFERTVIALNLIGLGCGFCSLGVLILAKGAHDAGSWISGVLGLLVGALFLLFAFYFCKHSWGGYRETLRTSKPIKKKSELSSLKKITV
jgi:O-antigen/teichoic acid export membrane protein